jgi:phosphoribosylformylglycinamidine cyclo-ligase
MRGHYAGLIDIGGGNALALHADGVGTKVLVAEMLKEYRTIGIDCVAMNVNDLICVGAEPVAMVDYLALEKMDQRLVKDVTIGLERGARDADVAIIAGETAVMPDVIHGFDLSAMSIGVVKRNRLITGEKVKVGDAIIGLASSGIHSNGLTLARKILFRKGFDRNIARELLTPTRIYVKQIMKLLKSKIQIHGLAHITGGAFSKLKRIGERANIGFCLNDLFRPHEIFKEIQEEGDVSDREMYRTFNMGTGFLVICPKNEAKNALRALPHARQVGEVFNERRVLVEDGSKKKIEVETW